MIVLDSDTGVVSSTVREVALSLDLAQLQVPSIEEEGVTCTSPIVRFSAQYDNRLIVHSGDKRPCARCKVGVDDVRMDFLPHLCILIVNANGQALDRLDRCTAYAMAANSIDSSTNEKARSTTSGNSELRHRSPLVSCDVIPITSPLIVAVSIPADQEDMALTLRLLSL